MRHGCGTVTIELLGPPSTTNRIYIKFFQIKDSRRWRDKFCAVDNSHYLG